MSKTPEVGVAVLIQHQTRVIIGRRIKAPMIGSWQLPGGWLPYGEPAKDIAVNKALQFSGIRVGDPEFLTVSDNHFDSGAHTISLYYRLSCSNPNGISLESNPACSDWCWADWYDLPRNLFLPLAELKASGWRI